MDLAPAQATWPRFPIKALTRVGTTAGERYRHIQRANVVTVRRRIRPPRTVVELVPDPAPPTTVTWRLVREPVTVS